MLASVRTGAVGLALTLNAWACSSQESTAASSEALASTPAPSVFDRATAEVTVEVDYAPGAEPYTEPTAAFDDPWTVFRNNAQALLGDKRLEVPSSLAAMERLDDLTPSAEATDKPAFALEDLVAIAAKHRNVVARPGAASIYIVFVDGYYRDVDGSVSTSTPGVSVRGTGVVAIFKPVVASTFRRPETAIYMEQATLVHELGHAVGLVGEGVATTSAHKSEDQGAHCKNPACIMYFKNVLVKDDVDFVDTYLKPRHGVLFGPECLGDVRALRDAP